MNKDISDDRTINELTYQIIEGYLLELFFKVNFVEIYPKIIFPFYKVFIDRSKFCNMWTNGEISAMLDIIEFQALSKFAGKYEGPLQDLPTEWDKIARKTNKSSKLCNQQDIIFLNYLTNLNSLLIINS